MTRHFSGGFTPYVKTLERKNTCRKSRKTKSFRFDIRNFFMSKQLSAFDFFFAPVIDLPLKPKHLERDIVSNSCYLSKRGQFEQNLLLSCFDLSDFKKSLEEQINTSCSVLEESIVQTYEKHSKTIQDKLQELFAVLERISMPLILNTLLMK